MPRTFHDILSDFYAGLKDRRPIGLGVSGGSDSLGLLYGLARIVPPTQLVVLTVDHGLRDGSADEARWVKARCRQLGVRHETLRWTGDRPVSGLQAAARVARYRLMGAAAARHGLAAVLTAHTRNDQDETRAMRRARSPANDAPGLAGIPPATLFDGKMWVLRPLLTLQREDIRDFLRRAGIEWIEDPSNADPRFERVRVRAMLAQQLPADGDADGAQFAIARRRLAGRAADFIRANCSETDGLVRIVCRPGEDADVVAAAVEAVIDYCGGAGRPLDRRGKATLARFLGGGSGGKGRQAISVGRCLIERNGNILAVRRESRGLEALTLSPGHSAVWDGRYRVRNLSNVSPLTVFNDRAGAHLPLFRRDAEREHTCWTVENGVAGGFVQQRLAGRSSHILPVYEMPVAQSLAQLARSTGFPQCPWTDLPEIAALTAMQVR
ncbi:tRNA lysidine(34) synthetase TilS [Hoeflea sp. YIM 152468]|uniref:tRNA lysidine(34) synthetase TilS n=1 Tax=Hoeflea sp. YIM 152468 TaxID=3031759 RepID=UPI0023DAB34E|nr:tRNA lysidine(34) synthetase TilS [Hoeflea sp. YIM 152468]MDF1607959.1 tRNA lysidine(34) synthetase TilS [Hoeflea sp. YIM 152468]